MHRLRDLPSWTTDAVSRAVPAGNAHDFNAPCVWPCCRWKPARGSSSSSSTPRFPAKADSKTQNTHSTGNRKRRPKKGRRYGKKKITPKRCHSFTFGLLITPSGYRIPLQIPHYTKEYCAEKGLQHRTTAEAAADLIRTLAVARRGRSRRAGRYGLRRRSRAARPARSEDISGSFRPTRSVFTKDRRASARKCVLV